MFNGCLEHEERTKTIDGRGNCSLVDELKQNSRLNRYLRTNDGSNEREVRDGVDVRKGSEGKGEEMINWWMFVDLVDGGVLSRLAVFMGTISVPFPKNQIKNFYISYI